MRNCSYRKRFINVPFLTDDPESQAARAGGEEKGRRGRRRKAKRKKKSVKHRKQLYKAIEHGQYLGANFIVAVVRLGGGNGTNDNNHSFYLHVHDGLR